MPGIDALLDAADDAIASLRAGVASAGLCVFDWPLVGPSPGWAEAIAAQALAPIVPAHAHRLLERDPAAGFCAGSASYPMRIGVWPASRSGSAATAVSPSSTRCGHSRSTRGRLRKRAK